MATKSRWRSLNKEEKQKVLERQYALKDRTRHGHWKGRKHWTETATPEQIAAWKEKVKAGRDKFWQKRERRTKNRRFNYKEGWDPTKKSLASKRSWQKWREEGTKIPGLIKEGSLKAKAEQSRKSRLIAEKKAEEVANNNPQLQKPRIYHATPEQIEERRQHLFALAQQAIASTGVPVPPDETIEYYQEIIDYFTPWVRY